MSQKDIVKALIETQGELYSAAMGADLAKGTPQPLFHWLLGTILLSARIASTNAVEAGRGLKSEGLHTIDGLLASDKSTRIRALNQHGYARYDTRTADYIIEAAELVAAKYGGDLRKLRDAADDAEAIVAALTEVKGIGATGAAIFCREAQLVWDPLYPRADGPALDAAKDLGLPTGTKALVDLAGSRQDFTRLMAALTRAALDGPADAVRAASRSGPAAAGKRERNARQTRHDLSTGRLCGPGGADRNGGGDIGGLLRRSGDPRRGGAGARLGRGAAAASPMP